MKRLFQEKVTYHDLQSYIRVQLMSVYGEIGITILKGNFTDSTGSYISETVPGESGDLEELDSIVKMSPNLQRYWERRAELLKEEEFYL